jgi:hypothetical protein
MRNERSGWRGLSVGLAAVLVAGLWCGPLRPGVLRAQQGGGSATRPAEPVGIEPQASGTSDEVLKGRMQQVQEAAVSERHRRMVADSDRLLQLATDLKAEVDKSTKDEMSVTAIKEATEIEKLAREVKERMKGN